MHASARARRQLGTVSVAPPRALGVIIGAGFVAWAAVLAGLAARTAASGEIEFKTFLAWAVAAVLGLLALLFANWTYSLWTLTYSIDRDALTIRWGLRRVIIPIESIQRMVPGRTLDEARIRGLNWWGCHVGNADVKRVGYTLFYSTHSTPDELLFIVTSEESYALTVLNQAAFAEEIQSRAALGPVEDHLQRSEAVGLAGLPFWRDRVALLAAGASGIACAILCGYLFAKYPGLPSVVQLSFPALGGVVRVGDKSELLRIAYLGAGILVTNTIVGVAVHARERAAGLWLLAGGGMLQGVLLLAAVVAVHRA